MDAEYAISAAVNILLVLGIVTLNAFFVAAEFALVKIRESQLEPAISKGKKRARVALHIVRNINRYLSATQLGITMASLALGWVSEPIFMALLDPFFGWLKINSEHLQHSIAIVTGFISITFLHIVAGELAPKWIAIQRPLGVALLVSRPLQLFFIISYPFSWALNKSAQWLLAKAGIEPKPAESRGHSEEELRVLFQTSSKNSSAPSLGWEIVLNALNLKSLVVLDVMRPRKDLVVLDTEATIDECRDVAERSRYSRLPLCEGGNPDKSLGVVHIKDLFGARVKAKRGTDLAAFARRIIYVPESARLETLLRLFLERKLHMAFVVDEYGGTTGIVTLENILEELVGQIQDEFDQEKPLLVKSGENTWEIDGSLPLHELEEIAGEILSEERIATVSGWVTLRLGGFPKPGDEIRFGNFQLRVLELDGLTVDRLQLRRDPPTHAT